jgi:hypothetical protein
VNTTTEEIARVVAERLVERLGDVAGELDGLVITLRESHVASASYEREL